MRGWSGRAGACEDIQQGNAFTPDRGLMLPTAAGKEHLGLMSRVNTARASEAVPFLDWAPFLLAPCGRLVVTHKQPPEPSVTHTIREKTKLLNRVRRIRGQIEAVERALEQEIGCADVLQLIAGARGAINGLMAEVMEDHVRAHLIDPAHEPDPQRAHAAEELIDVVRSYLR
jgi:DNA-binding FrmR family transcriptional regulator